MRGRLWRSVSLLLLVAQTLLLPLAPADLGAASAALVPLRQARVAPEQRAVSPSFALAHVAPEAASGGAINAVATASATPTPPPPPPPSRRLNFEPNVGQADPAVRFLAHAPGGALLFTPGEVVLALGVAGAPAGTPTPGPTPSPSPTPVSAPAPLLRLAGLRFLGAAAPTIHAGAALSATVNYFRGADPAAWHANVPTYDSLTYTALYPGIDLRYSGATGQLKGTYTVAAGGDPAQIHWRYDGAGAVRVDDAGNLQIRLQEIITSPLPITLTEQAPLAWQQSGATRLPVSVAYRLAPDASVSFVLGSYNPTLPLTIDPSWSYSTYLGGSGYDTGNGVAVDAAGNAYIVGTTTSTDFPLESPFQDHTNGNEEVFVSKLNPIGSQLVYSTYLGGSDSDLGQAIAVDASGNAYLTGTTLSQAGNAAKGFPTTAGAFQTQCGDPTFCHYHPSAFVTKITPAGSSLAYSTYFGGAGTNHGTGIAVSLAGEAYFTGWTMSGPDTFPLSATALQKACPGAGRCAFVARLNSSGSDIVYSTYLGGGSENEVNHGYGSIAVDSAGYAYVTGYTSSAKFPVHNPIQISCPACALGAKEAFVSKLNTDGSALVYSTYLGGSADTGGTGIAVDSSGAAYVSGFTYATDHPTTPGAYRRQYSAGGAKTFVTKVNPAGTAWAYSTYLMVGNEWMPAAIDSGGNVYVAGNTSEATTFPLWQAAQPTYGGGLGGDAVVLKLNAAGSGLVYATYLGGSGDDAAEGIAVDGRGNAYVTGVTHSALDFPRTPFALQPTCAGSGCQDAFVTKVPAIGGAARGGPGSDENWGGGGVSACPVCEAGAPVDTASGNFWHTFADLAVPGRGVPLLFSRTYNSQAITSNGPLGYGWTHSYNLWIDGDSVNWYVHQAGGAVAPFPKSGAPYPWVAAALSFDGDTATFTPNQGQVRYIFQTLDNTGVYRLTQIIDRNGYATSLSYSNGLLRTVADAASRTLTLTYTQVISNLLLTSVSDNLGRTAAYTYTDSLGNLTAATDIGGQTTRFTYNTSSPNPILQHQLLTMTDPNQGTVTNTYDAHTRLATQQDPLSRALQLSYTPLAGDASDPTAMQTTLTDSLGYTTVYTYDANRLTALTRNPGPEQRTWTYAYSTVFPTGITTSTDPLNHTWTASWDANGNRLSESDPLGHTTLYAYNTTNDLLVLTNSLSLPITYTYDISGNLTSVAQPWVEQNKVATTSFAYDPLHAGDVLTVTNALGKQSFLAYDAYGYVLTATNPLGESTRFNHDALGRLLSVVAPRGGTTSYTPNVYGLPVQAQDALGYTSVFTYDADLNLVQTRDPDGREVSTTYDRDNEPTRVTYADLTHADARYDAGGRVISQTNPLGQATLYDYDSFSRLITVTTPLTVTAVYTYDQAGNMTVLTNANGLRTTFGYDDANQLRTIGYADGQTPGVSFDYNALGMRTVMTDGTGVNLYSYDSLLRLTSYTNGANASVGYGYDLAGRLTTLTYPGSHTVTRGYDDANQLTSVRDWLGTGNLSQFSYDHDGNLNSITYANGVLGTLGYDAADQLRALTYTLGSNIFLQQTYTPDPAGVLASTTERQSGVLQGTHAYSYDNRYHLTGDGLSGGATTSTSTWAVDPASEITATSYTLNAGVPVTTTRGYNAGNELLSFLQAQGATTQHSYTLTYDPPGNRRSEVDTLPGGQTTTYGYDQADRLTSWTQGTSSATYRYDGNGLRQSKTVGATTTPFTWDVGAGLPLLLADGTAQYLYGPGGMLLEQVQGTTPYYYQVDRLGSVRALTDNTGTVQDTYTYDAYGNTTSTGPVANPFGYTGQYQDGESGLYYLRARYYDPAIQQFLTADPLALLTGTPYAYASGSPVNGSDPSGLDPNGPDYSGDPSHPSLWCFWTDQCSVAERYAKNFYQWRADSEYYWIVTGWHLQHVPMAGSDDPSGAGGLAKSAVACSLAGGIRGAPLGAGDSGGPTAGKDISAAQREADLQANKNANPRGHYSCSNCGYENTDPKHFDVDHIIPKSQGGNTSSINRRVLCVGCNRSAQEGWPPRSGSDWATKHPNWDMQP